MFKNLRKIIITLSILSILAIGCQPNVRKDSIEESATMNPDVAPHSETKLQEEEELTEDDFIKLLTDYQVATVPDSADITTISESAIVYIGISSAQIDKLKKAYGEEDFYVGADDSNWYTYQFDQMLDSLPYQVLRPVTRYLHFAWGNESLLIDTEKQGRQTCLCWDYILFKQGEAPMLLEDTTVPNRQQVVQFMENGSTPSIFNEYPHLWKKPSLLIEQQFKELKPGEKISDEVFAGFLIEYESIIDQLNKILFSSEDYEIYNSLIYMNETNHDPIAKAFAIKLEELGLSWSFSEGQIFIERSTSYLNSKFARYWSPTMTEFMHMYSIEVDHAYSEDGGISISLNLLVDRVVYWENFNRKYPTFVLKEHSMENERYYTYFLLNGMDNTPAFGYDEKGQLDPDFKNAYEYAIKKYPTSKFTATAKEYLKLLSESQFTLSTEVSAFLMKFNI